ncbi:hypothetical protein [Gemmata sp.]
MTRTMREMEAALRWHRRVCRVALVVAAVLAAVVVVGLAAVAYRRT